MPQPARRLEVFTESVIRQMTRLANQHGALNLAQGFPDFDPPAELIDALAIAIRGPHHQYAITWGAPRFRQALAKKHHHFSGQEIDPEQHLVVTCGSTEAMMVAIMTACDPGDRVIIFSPFYENYGADAILSGAIPVHVPLHAPDFHFDPDQLRSAFASGAKAIVVCNPSNPCGKVFTREELEFIGSLATEFDAFVIMDEVYEHIVYPGHTHVPLMTLPGMRNRCVRIGSAGKTFSLTGWKVGYVTAAPELLAPMAKAHQFLTFTTPPNLQRAVAFGLAKHDSYYTGLAADMRAKRDRLQQGLEGIGFAVAGCAGTYFLNADFRPLGFNGTDEDFCRHITEKAGVAAVPVSAFYTGGGPAHFARFCFAKTDATLDSAIARLGRHFGR